MVLHTACLCFFFHVYTHIENVQELFCGGGLQGPRCQHLGVIFVREKLQKDHNNVTHTHMHKVLYIVFLCMGENGK